MSKLFFRYGAMNSGKSTAMLQVAHNYEERDQSVVLVKSSVDTKGDDQIVSRLGVSRRADLLLSPGQPALDGSGALAAGDEDHLPLWEQGHL